MKEYTVVIFCKDEIYALGLKTALSNERVKIIYELEVMSEDKIIITDSFFNNFYNKNKVINIYDNIKEAVFSNKDIKILKGMSILELKKALEAAKNDKKYISSEIIREEERISNFMDLRNNLTVRERNLIIGIIEEQTNAQIAKKLFLSEKTIKNNLTELYKKIGVKDRNELRKMMIELSDL